MSTRALEWIIERLLFLCAALSVLTTAGIIAVLAFETYEFLREVPILEFLTGTEWTPLFANAHFGVLPLVVGTLLVSAVHAGDYSLVLGITTVSILAVSFAVLLIDLAYPLLDPRVKAH